MKRKPQILHVPHVHTSSIGQQTCSSCNPHLKDDRDPIIYINTCIKCEKQFLAEGKKDVICDNCMGQL